MANEEEKCYSANHNEPGASLSISGGDVSLSLGIKASISKAPYGECQCSVHTHCTQCVLHVTRQLPHFLPSSLWSLLIFRSMSMETLARYTSDSLHDVTMKKSCLAGLFSFFFYLRFPEIPLCFHRWKQRLQIGFVCFPRGVFDLSPCHTRQLAGKVVLLEGDLLSLSLFFLAFAFFSY